MIMIGGEGINNIFLFNIVPVIVFYFVFAELLYWESIFDVLYSIVLTCNRVQYT